MRRADRLFQMVQILRGRKLTTAQHLADVLEISPRSVYRDVADLIASGVPIHGEAGVGYVLAKGFDVPPLMFTQDELEALWLGVRVVQSWGDPALADAAARTLAKVEAVLPERLATDLANTSLFAPAYHVPAQMTRYLAQVRGAVRAKRKVRVTYQPLGRAPEERLLRPLGLAFWGDAWTLAAWCELRAAYRTFRLDRLVSLEVTPMSFTTSAQCSMADFLRQRANDPTPTPTGSV